MKSLLGARASRPPCFAFIASFLIMLCLLVALVCPQQAQAQSSDVAFREWVRTTLAEIQTHTNTWMIASGPLTDLTNRIAQVESSTSTWNTASATAISATGRVAALEASTNDWNGAVAALAAGVETNFVVSAEGTNYTLSIASGVVTNAIIEDNQ